MKLKRELRACVALEHRYLTHDPTMEKLGELLRENPQGLLLVRDELSGWLASLDRKGREGERQFFLEAWNGTGSYSFDRIGRGTIHVPALCVSVLGGIQPTLIEPLLEQAVDQGAGADGLVQRFQLAVWPDESPPWHNADRLPNERARVVVEECCRAIDRLPLGDSGAIPTVHFTEDAQELFDEWRSDLEQRLRTPAVQATPAFAGHLAKYRKLMPALALIYGALDAASAGQQIHAPVKTMAAQSAIALCKFFEAHARKLYSVELDPSALAAHALAKKLKSGALYDGMTVRDLQRADWSGLIDADAACKGLGLLEQLGWIRLERRETGGRPSDVVQVNPALLSGFGSAQVKDDSKNRRGRKEGRNE
jgi:hypothetical protein